MTHGNIMVGNTGIQFYKTQSMTHNTKKNKKFVKVKKGIQTN